jgi:hypothetical protein
MIDPRTVVWPSPWQPIADEGVALTFGRSMSDGVAASIVGELHREICSTHPLFGVECRPLAYDARSKKDFLFETENAQMPLVMVHFTWAVENDPRWPFIIRFGRLDEFLKWARRN